jgi:hypothetical protein
MMMSIRWISRLAGVALVAATMQIVGISSAHAVAAFASGSASASLKVTAITGAVSGAIDPAPADLGLFTDIALCDDPIDCLNDVLVAGSGFGARSSSLGLLKNEWVKRHGG